MTSTRASTPSPSASPTVEFWFDPVCPWCWMTSRWAAEVAEVRGFEITWNTLSLQILNEDQAGAKPSHGMGMRVLRVIEGARQEHGDDVVGALYTAAGTRIHPQGMTDGDQIISEILEEVGLPAELAAHADGSGDAIEKVLRKNTEYAMEIAGPDVGVPVISIDGVAFFGPVVTPAPTGEQALQLWDGILAAASVEGFYELKRGRTQGPIFDDAR